MSHFTFGIEEEFLIVDKEGRPISFPEGKHSEKEFSVNYELYDCTLELSSRVLNNLNEIEPYIKNSRNWAKRFALEKGGICFIGGSHPTLRWDDLSTRDEPYFKMCVDDYQYPMLKEFVFGLHAHIGGIEENKLPFVFNKLKTWLPFFSALAANSTHWKGKKTGLASTRLNILDGLPRMGLPPNIESIESHFKMIDAYIKTGCIKTPTQLWYDMRIHPHFKTIEVRVMDMQESEDKTIALLNLLFPLIIEIEKGFELPIQLSNDEWAIQENRWRAVRYGKDASFIMHDLSTKAFKDIHLDLKKLLIKAQKSSYNKIA